MHGRADALYDQKYHPMDEVTRPKSAFKHRKRSIHTTSENEVDNITPRFHEGIHHSKRTSGRKRPCYNTETHTQDQLLALADIRRLNNRRHPQKKVKIENDRESETVQVNVRARSDSDVCDLSREEVFMHSALGVHDRNDFGTKARYRDELVVPNTTSGEDDSVSPVIDGFKIPVPFDCSHPIQGEFDKESSTQCIEPFRLSSPIGWSEIAAIPPDTSHSIHDQKNPGCDYSDGTGWIDIAKRAVEELQKISHNPEESVPLDYDIFVQGNERTPVARRLPRISSFTLSSEYSCGQLQSPLMTEARDGRKVARFQVYMDSWQSTPNEDHFISTFEQSPDEATGNMPRQILTEEDENLKVSLQCAAWGLNREPNANHFNRIR